MYIVIFKATMKHLDQQYLDFAANLRQKAFEQYDCQKFESYTEDHQEIALSYWLSLDDINAWKNDPEHRIAQQLGREKWYSNFSTEIYQSLD